MSIDEDSQTIDAAERRNDGHESVGFRLVHLDTFQHVGDSVKEMVKQEDPEKLSQV
jgi:hypothetical protein